MDSTQQAEQTITALPAQEEPRLPKISPRIFGQLNRLDEFVGRSPLSRAEHQEAAQIFQNLMRHIETLENPPKVSSKGA